MTAQTHAMAGTTALLAAVIVVSPGDMTVATAIGALLANQIGCMAPDIDQPTAPLWRNLPVGRIFGRIFGVLVGGHRFLLHSIIGVVLFAVAARLALEYTQPIMPRVDIHIVWVAFLIGVVSHLIMDSFTKEGVPWLLPLPVKFGFPPIKKLRITTGKKFEMLVVLPLLSAAAIWLASSHYSTLATVIQNHLQK